MQFKQLDVWKRSSRLSVELYKYSEQIKNYGYRDQITRAALSIPSNIAEGSERDSTKDTIRFLNIAKASGAEVMTQLYIGIEAGFVDKSNGHKWIEEVEIICKQIGALIKHKKNAEN